MTLVKKTIEQAAATRLLIEAAGGLDATSAATGVSISQLGRYQSATERDSMPLRLIEKVESITRGTYGHPIITRHLARKAGCTLFELPEVPRDRMAVSEIVVSLINQRAEWLGELLPALIEDALDKHTARTLMPTLYCELELTCQMLAELEAIAGEAT